MTHFWEVPAFESQGAFTTNVINMLLYGDVTDNAAMPGLWQYTDSYPFNSNLKVLFSHAASPQVFIITPRSRTPNPPPGSILYAFYISQLKQTISDIFPGLTPQIIPYTPDSEENAQLWTSSGKILFQYDNLESEKLSTTLCKVLQFAAFRLWVEDRPAIYSSSWLAKPWQRSLAVQRKRQEACYLSLSSSVPTPTLGETIFTTSTVFQTRTTDGGSSMSPVSSVSRLSAQVHEAPW
jgi:hypothetical protein